jgi:hypothetical protein
VTANNSGIAQAKRTGRRTWLLLAAAAAAGAVALAPANTASPQVSMPPPKLSPGVIPMGAFYNGARLRIEGTAPPQSGVVIVIEGSERDEFFNRKGRVGPLWLNVDRIHVKNAPSVFLRFSSSPLHAMIGSNDIDHYQLDEAAIMDRIRFLCRCRCSLTDRSKQSGAQDAVPDPAYSQRLYADFLQLKHRNGTYREQPGAIQLAAAPWGTAYALEFDWPRNIPPGRYRVSVCACSAHQVIAQSSATLQLQEVGFPAYMSRLAFATPWMYGIGAVLAAAFAGFLTDLLANGFRRKRKAQSQTGAQPPEPSSVTPEEAAAETHEPEISHRR